MRDGQPGKGTVDNASDQYLRSMIISFPHTGFFWLRMKTEYATLS